MLSGKTLKIYLPETRRPRPLLLSVWLHLVNLYLGYLNYSPGIKKMALSQGSVVLHTHTVKIKNLLV